MSYLHNMYNNYIIDKINVIGCKINEFFPTQLDKFTKEQQNSHAILICGAYGLHEMLYVESDFKLHEFYHHIIDNIKTYDELKEFMKVYNFESY